MVSDTPARVAVLAVSGPLAAPVAYSFFDDIVEWRRRRSAKRFVDRGEAELAALESGQVEMHAQPASAE